MKNFILLSLLVTSAATPALAISRYSSMSMTCAEARAIINRERAVIMRYPARRTPNMTLYDRYVADSGACDVGFMPIRIIFPRRIAPPVRSIYAGRQPTSMTMI